MTNSARVIIFLLLTTLLAVAAESSEYMLFSSRPQEGELLIPERGKGVLVRRITIKPGDTLSQISRDFSGRSSYFPQILLFNDIPNPDLIRAGRELIVPISKHAAISRTSTPKKNVSIPVKKETLIIPRPAKVTNAVANISAKKNRHKSAGKVELKKQLSTEQLAGKEEQDSYSLAISAYRKKEYQQSLLLFSRFLETYPSSSLAADASLYKAESLFMLSGQ